MADLSLKEYENLILSSLEEAQQMDVKSQSEALMKKTGEDRKSWLSQFYDSLFGKTSEATAEPFQTAPLEPIVPDQAVMMQMAQIAAPLQNSPMLDMYQGMDVDNTEDVTQAQAERLRASLDAQMAAPTDSGITETSMVDVTESDMGKLTNPEPLYEMAKEIDPGTIETKELGLMSPPPLPTSESRGGMFKMAEGDAQNIAMENIGIDETMWAAYKKEVAKIESGGKKNPYQVAGGANNHYDGKYQLGKMAKADAGQLLGIDLKHDKKARDAFRKNPALQEKAFAAYTAKNHSYLMNKSAKYRELDKQQQIAVLGYAHNQGWSEAKKWLDGGKEGQDAFGTKGSKYYKAIAKNLGITPSLAFTEGRESSPRPRLRDDE